jgi:hypothetical protein
MVAFPKDAPWGAAIGHQFDLVITVRQLEIDPGQRLAVFAAPPKFAQSEHTFIKSSSAFKLVTTNPTCIMR